VAVDSKNAEALSWGPEFMLGKFANLPDKSGNSKQAEGFRDRFGELFPGVNPEDYWIEVSNFRKAWHAKTPQDVAEVGRYLTALLNRSRRPHVKDPPGEMGVFQAILAGDPRYFPALSVDFSDGRIKPGPSVTLLDWLASGLVKYRRMLGICKREECPAPYFVKPHPRAKYCSPTCFQESRLGQKSVWWVKNRGGDAKPTTGKRIQKKSKRSGRGGRR
jgi:hypothetical protein